MHISPVLHLLQAFECCSVTDVYLAQCRIEQLFREGACLVVQGYLVHFLLVQLIPKPVGCQHQILLLVVQLVVGEDWFMGDIGAGERVEFREVVLPVLEVEVTQGPGRLESSLHVAVLGVFYALIDVTFVREFPLQSCLLLRFSRIEANVDLDG